jgi:hypothetical protein
MNAARTTTTYKCSQGLLTSSSASLWRPGGLRRVPHSSALAFRFNRRTSASRGKLFYRLAQQAVHVGPAPFCNPGPTTTYCVRWREVNIPFKAFQGFR